LTPFTYNRKPFALAAPAEFAATVWPMVALEGTKIQAARVKASPSGKGAV